MTSDKKEQILEYAKLHYKPGTVYLPMHLINVYNITNTIPDLTDCTMEIYSAHNYIVLIKNGDVLKDNVSNFFHVLGRINTLGDVIWSKIVSKPVCYEI